MGVEKLLGNKLLVEGSNRKVHTVARHAGIALTGYSPDTRVIANTAEVECSNYNYNYDSAIPPHVLAQRLGSYLHVHTLYGGYR